MIQIIDGASSVRAKYAVQVLVIILIPVSLATYLTATSSVQGFEWNRTASFVSSSVDSEERVLGNPVFELLLPKHDFFDCTRVTDGIFHDRFESNPEVLDSLEIDIVIIDRYCRAALDDYLVDDSFEDFMSGFNFRTSINEIHYGFEGSLQVWERTK